MLTTAGNGRLTRDVQLRTTQSGKRVATVSVASDRRDRQAEPVYVDLILWDAHAEAAARHLVKGQAVTFSGRLDLRSYQSNSGDQRVAIEIHNADLEYGPRPHGPQKDHEDRTHA